MTRTNDTIPVTPSTAQFNTASLAPGTNPLEELEELGLDGGWIIGPRILKTVLVHLRTKVCARPPKH
jgi:hypothetical protein